MGAALRFLLEPDFSKISFGTLMAAIGQAFFSIGIGMGSLIVFGAYMPKDFSIPRLSTYVILMDTGVAVLAGFAIFPLVFAYGLTPDGGPGLIFQTLPLAFGQMPGGLIFGSTTHRELKPRLGRQAALRFVHQLADHPDWHSRAPRGDGEAPLTQAMSALRRVARPGSLVVVLSDFLGFSRSAQSYLSSVARHNEVLAVFLSDPLERQLPPPGRYRLVADDEELAIDTHVKAARRDYRDAFAERVEQLETFCQRYGVHLMPLSTEDDPVTTLQTALGRRAH